MNLELSSKEFLTLIKALYLADCVANAHATDSTDMDWDISRLRRKIFALAGDEGFPELVRHDAGNDDCLESEELAEEMDATVLRKHVDMVFWRELAARLTDKIMDQKFGAEMDGWKDDHYNRRREPIQKKVEAEIQANGINNLFLLGQF